MWKSVYVVLYIFPELSNTSQLALWIKRIEMNADMKKNYVIDIENLCEKVFMAYTVFIFWIKQHTAACSVNKSVKYP